MIRLSEADRAHWEQNHWVHLRGALAPAERAALAASVGELARWPETPGRWMQYFERGTARRQLCRIENFVPYHEGLRGFLEREDLAGLLASLLDEPVLLFKEKINYKLPGGAGFAPHQDAPAFASFGQRLHVTLLASVDRATRENGCLEIVRAATTREALPQAEDGALRTDVVEHLVFEPVETEPGDLVLFDSYVPHRSGPNRSQAPRRALYVTWNRASEGDRRDDYFARKRRAFPPESERDPTRPVDPADAAIFNLGNPIR